VWAAPAAGVEPKPVSFPAADGMKIAADYYAPPSTNRGDAPLVILLHMYRSDRKAWEPLIAPLQEAGFAILALDLRGHGESATTETRDAVVKRDAATFKKMQADVRGAYDWLAAQEHVDRARFALVGASVGCSIALRYAAQDRSVDALVCLSPGLNYMELDSTGDMRQITGRKILMLATADERDAPYTLKQRGQSVETHIYDDQKAHGTQMFGVVAGIEKEIATFLKSGVGGSATTLVVGSIEKNIYHQPGSEWAKQISPTNLRYYSSPAEAEARGLRGAKTPGKTNEPGDRPRDTPPRRSGSKRK
jgi:pimeloyl-ACP methyl ester carboxylesterase